LSGADENAILPTAYTDCRRQRVAGGSVSCTGTAYICQRIVIAVALYLLIDRQLIRLPEQSNCYIHASFAQLALYAVRKRRYYSSLYVLSVNLLIGLSNITFF